MVGLGAVRRTVDGETCRRSKRRSQLLAQSWLGPGQPRPALPPRRSLAGVPGGEFQDDLYLDFDVPLSAEPGNRAFFGRNVLQGLIDGIDDFVQARQPRWERDSYRVGAPVLLGCSPWVNDDKLVAAIEGLSGACIVINKHPRTAGGSAGAERLRDVNERTNGIELRTLTGLGDIAPKQGGQPRVIGPYDTMHDEGACVSTFRTMGFRKTRRNRPPIAHAKLALLGNICWTDEHPTGHIVETVWFSPRRAMGLLSELHLRVAQQP